MSTSKKETNGAEQLQIGQSQKLETVETIISKNVDGQKNAWKQTVGICSRKNGVNYKKAEIFL